MKDIEDSIESQIVQANQAINEKAEAVNKAKDECVEGAAQKIEATNQETQAQTELLKTGANAAIDQGLKAAETAANDQLRTFEKTIDEKMKAASKEFDDKMSEANKFADEKRQEITHVMTTN